MLTRSQAGTLILTNAENTYSGQ
ncbi:MAG: hypothetical protein HZB98_06430 [Bacteroidia bacterium]|nr:hypothetical protein [Bacteroidia bacterium]